MKKMLILAATIAAALSVNVATSGATPQTPTPNGYCGALNMLQAGAGMGNAMSVDNANGNTGMFTAVGNSACG